MSDNLSRALQLLASGHLDEARIYLEELLRQDPDNPDLLYNLGLCYVDLGQLEKGMELLHRCLQFAPGHSHAYVALGIAYQKKGDFQQAKEYAMRALAADPKNPVALKNLGAIFGQESDSLRALYYLRRSNECDPLDPQTVCGLARLLAAPGMPAARSTDLGRSRYLSIFVVCLAWHRSGTASLAWRMVPNTSLYVYGSKKFMDLQMQRL